MHVTSGFYPGEGALPEEAGSREGLRRRLRAGQKGS
jgi:hypothetical protein